MNSESILEVPATRSRGLRSVAERLLRARSVVLCTHVQADGDGAGSQAAVADWLESRGARVTIVNPTPFPEGLRFLLHRADLAPDAGSPEAEAALSSADLFLVLDTSEPARIGTLAPRFPADRTIVVDHHPPGRAVVGHEAVQDDTAAATGELVYDLVTLAGDPITPVAAMGMYVALVSDTGSFRYANTTPRVHAIVARLMERGIDPEWVYRRLFATAPRRRLELLREALGNLHTDPETGIAWMIIEARTADDLQATSEDFEGLVEHVRSLEGTEIALLLRGNADGETKISLRSNGEADVNRIAREFGGGGHVKAAGARVAGSPQEVAARIVEVARRELARVEGGG